MDSLIYNLEYYLDDSSISWDILCRSLGFVHFCHYFSYYCQIKGLIGCNGIMPIDNKIETIKSQLPLNSSIYQKWRKFPVLFWLGYNDKTLILFCLFGIISSILICIIPNYFWLLWYFLLLGNITIYHAFGPFILQTEPFFIEISFLLCILCPFVYFIPIRSPFYLLGFSNNSNYNYGSCIGLWVVRWLIGRMMLSAGAVKWYGSNHWREGTAMDLHYFTQPLVNPFSFLFNRLPHTLHKWSIWFTFIVEGPLPFCMFLPIYWIRWCVLLGYIGLMFMINISGNYAYLGITTCAVSLSILSDGMLPNFIKSIISTITPSFNYRNIINEIFILHCLFEIVDWIIIICLSIIIIYHTAAGISSVARQCKLTTPKLISKLTNSFVSKTNNLALINHYGMFGSMHGYRWEIIIEGSMDGVNWKQYIFNYKVNSPNDGMKFLPLWFWPRLDWMIWFLPLYIKRATTKIRPALWFSNLMVRLLQNKKEVNDLFKSVPFKEKPKYIRAIVYDYKMNITKHKEQEVKSPILPQNINFLVPENLQIETIGSYWTCKGPVVVYVPPSSLNN